MREWVLSLTESPVFGLAATSLAYCLAVRLGKKYKSPLFNPLVFSLILLMVFLAVTGIPLENYQKGGSLINGMLTPVTAVLALNVYRRRETLRKKWLPILAGCIAGALTAIGCTVVLCRVLGLDDQMLRTLLPKSVTGPFAVLISGMIGGIPSVSIACVSITGITGLILSPYILRLFRMKDPVAQGVALGTSCHALGTVRAMEMGEEQAAMSSLAMCLSGIVMTLFCLLLR